MLNALVVSAALVLNTAVATAKPRPAPAAGPPDNGLRHVTFNLQAAKIRHDTMEGRPYLVVPMVMITEGVHNGSNGPLLYPKDELSKAPTSWDHKPVVVYHPKINGVGVSACDPVILTSQKVGVIMNTQATPYKVGKRELVKLTAEAWLEETRLQAVDERVLNALNSGQVVEVSTGLFLENEAAEGDWEGEPYVAIARNYRPDHLAILPDQKGACSIADGAGLARNEEQPTDNEPTHDATRDLLQAALKAEYGVDSYCYVTDVFHATFIYSMKGKLWRQSYTVTDTAATLIGEAQEVVRVVSYQTNDGEMVEEQVDNTWSDEARKASAEARTKMGNPQHGAIDAPGLGDTLDAMDRKSATDARVKAAVKAEKVKSLSKQLAAAKSQGDTEATKRIEDKLAKVTRVRIPKHPSGKSFNEEDEDNEDTSTGDESDETNNSEDPMNKKQMVDNLIANGNGVWTEADRAFLMSKDLEQLKTITNQTTAPANNAKGKDTVGTSAAGTTTVVTPTTNAGPTPEKEPSVEEYIAKAPRAIRHMLANGLRVHEGEKKKLIAAITGNARNSYTPAELEAKDIEELQKLYTLSAPSVVDLNGQPSYAGLADAFAPATGRLGAVSNEEPLPLTDFAFDVKK